MSIREPPRDPAQEEICTQGVEVASFNACVNAANEWVEALGAKTKARIAWRYECGVARLYHLGDTRTHLRVLNVVARSGHLLRGTLIEIRHPTDP